MATFLATLALFVSCVYADLPPFPGAMASAIPHDIDNDAIKALDLDNQEDLAVGTRLFDILSWQTFTALNWPTGPDGTPKQSLKEKGDPQWATWKESYEIFLEDGSEPEGWGTPTKPLSEISTISEHQGSVTTAAWTDTIMFPAPTDAGRTLFRLSSTAPIHEFNTGDEPGDNRLSDVRQAHTLTPLWDQYGNRVYYEILVNKEEFDFIKDNKLYNIDGQIVYQQKNPNLLAFPRGKNEDQRVGAIELKLAWRILTEEDIHERFFTRSYNILQPDKSWKKMTMGLVGLHAAHKTFYSAIWLWSTFEQVDNLEVDPAEVARYLKEGKTLKPSFYDNTSNAVPNTDPRKLTPVPHPLRTQVTREVAIAATTAELNELAIDWFVTNAPDSPWQYYQLVGTQWPREAGGYPHGNPTPRRISNTVMETYDQKSSCIHCHAGARLPALADSTRKVIAEGKRASADFSWLLTVKAEWEKTSK